MLKEILVQPVFAAVEPINALDGIANLGDLVNYVVNILVIIGFAIVIIMLAIGFVKYVTSQGEKTAVESAQKTLTYSVIGGVGLILVYTLKIIILNLLGIDDPTSQDAFGNEVGSE